MFKKTLWKILSLVFASLLILCIGVNYLGGIMEGQLNEMFGLTKYDKVTDEADASDTEYFKQLYNADNIEDYYRAVNEEVEAEGLVLLKNENNALPLDKGSKVSLLLSGSADLFYASHGPGKSNVKGLIDLKTAFEEDNRMKVNPDLDAFYRSKDGKSNYSTLDGITKTNEKGWNFYSASLRGSIDNYGDAAIVVLTRRSGEGSDITAFGSDGKDGSYLSLTAEEISVLEALAEKKTAGTVKRIVVLINASVTVQCDFLFDEAYAIDAAMWIGAPGGSGTRAVAKALIGEVNPSGKLSDTFLKNNFASPAGAYWKVNEGFSNSYANAAELSLNSTQEFYGVYVEGIYVGYRYHETRYEDYVMNRSGAGAYKYADEVAYPFGFGLSYTNFEYSDFTVAGPDENGDYTLSVTVKNIGNKAGKESVQFYLQKPYSEYDQRFGIEKASVELAGFAKTKVLQPGLPETLSVKINKEQFKTYDGEVAKTYILDVGEHYFTVARNAHDAVNNLLALKADEGKSVTAAYMDAAGDKSLAKMVWENEKLDTITYSNATETGSGEEAVKITNHLDFMDPNHYAGVENKGAQNGDVTYVSRFNWEGTFPTQKTNLALTANGSVKYDITSHKPIVEEEGATMPTYGASNGLTLIQLRGKDYDDPMWDQLLDQIPLEGEGGLWQYVTGCYGYTPEIPDIMKPLTDEDDGPYGVSNCKEGYSSMSCEGIIAATLNEEIFTKVGAAIASDARSGNISGEGVTNLNQKNLHGLYAPGLNMHRVAFGGRASEYFSEDPYLSGIAAVFEIQAMQEQGVVAHPKHYIFNDEESHRNGIGIWMNEQTAREIYLLPWEYALRPSKGNAHAIMTSFNRAGAIWTSASDDLMNKIMRDEWKFDGYALTDMAESNGGSFMCYDDGFMNGTDCFLGRGTDPLKSNWSKSPTFNQNIREAAHRMLYICANYSAAMNGISESTRFVKNFIWWQALLTSLVVIFAVLTVASVAMYVVSIFMTKKNEEIVMAEKEDLYREE